MKKTSLLALALSLTATLSGAADETATFRQRYDLDAARTQQNKAKVAADLKAAKIQSPALAAYVVPALSATKRMPDRYPEDGRLYAPLSWIASRGEFEPASFLLFADKDQDAVTLKVSDLTGKSGRIPASAIDLRVVKLWYQGGSAWYGYFADALGRTLVPELLLRDENLIKTDDKTKDYYVRYENADGGRRYAWMSSKFETTDYRFDNQANQGLIKDAEKLQPFVLNANEFKQLFATIRVPDKARAGVYKGEIEIRSKAGLLGKLPMRVRVLPLDLPDPKTCYNLDKDFYLCLYGTDTRNPKILRNLAEHNAKTPMGFPSINAMNPGAFAKELALAKETGIKPGPFIGVPSVGLAVHSNPISKKDQQKLDSLRNTMEKVAEICKKELGKVVFYSYGCDEGGPSVIRAERPAWQIAHDVGGKVMVSSYAHRQLIFALDFLIMPGMPVEKRQKELELFHESNPDALVGWYANPHCGPECPDYFRRIHGLSAWKAGYDVAANYCWWRNNWNDMAVPYEPNLRAIVCIYGAADGILDTLAWEGMREGLDDIRYATLLKQLALKAAKSEDGQVLAKGRRVLSFLAYWDGYRDDPDAFRAECINHILDLNAALQGKK